MEAASTISVDRQADALWDGSDLPESVPASQRRPRSTEGEFRRPLEPLVCGFGDRLRIREYDGLPGPVDRLRTVRADAEATAGVSQDNGAGVLLPHEPEAVAEPITEVAELLHFRKLAGGKDPPVEKGAEERRHVADRCDQRTRGPHVGGIDAGDVAQTRRVNRVPARVPSPDGRARREVGVPEGEGAQDSPVEDLLELLTGDPLDEQPQHDVAGVGVGEVGAGNEQQRVARAEANEVDRVPYPQRVGEVVEAWILGVVEQPAGMAE